MIHNLSNGNSLLSQFIAEIRDVEIQKDQMRFRKNLERIGEIFAYEISKTLQFQETETTTPLGVALTKQLSAQPVIASIMRAGLPMHQGLLNFFDQAQSAFVSAFRKHHKNNTLEVNLEYISCPDLNERILIICDPMLASGSSMETVYKALLEKGTPQHIHIVTAIASIQGINYLKAHLPVSNHTLWCAAIDEELTAHAYIVPGLGDAGDLAFGNKL
jgi:uracil phosphoribosyltransferase